MQVQGQMECFCFLSPEEILQSPFALWWAPDGNSLLYGRFDDSSVENYQFPLYGSNSDPSLTQYTTIDRIAYPKVCGGIIQWRNKFSNWLSGILLGILSEILLGIFKSVRINKAGIIISEHFFGESFITSVKIFAS